MSSLPPAPPPPPAPKPHQGTVVPPPPAVAVVATVVTSPAEMKARRWLAMGVSLSIVGTIIAVTVAGYHYNKLRDDVALFTRASAGQSAVVEVVETVEWRVYVEPDDAPLRDVRWSITGFQTGEPAAFDSQRGFSYDTGTHTGRSLAAVDLEPGEYLLEVEGPQTIAVGPSQLGRLTWLWAGALGFGGVPILVGVILIAIASVRRARLRRLVGTPRNDSAAPAG